MEKGTSTINHVMHIRFTREDMFVAEKLRKTYGLELEEVEQGEENEKDE